MRLFLIRASSSLHSAAAAGQKIQHADQPLVRNFILNVVPHTGRPPQLRAGNIIRDELPVGMSTIIGFAGGGGIGFLPQQDISLLNYHAASVQMLAIAMVVALMDYLSSNLRERTV